MIQSSLEIEFLFICLSNRFRLDPDQTMIHQQSIQILSKCLSGENEEILNYTLQGIQDGIVFLARSGDSSLAIHYLGQLCPLVYQLLIFISKKNLNQRIHSICGCGVNILLASFSLMESKNISSFLSLIIPTLLVIFRFGKEKNLVDLKKLSQQCFTRLGSSHTDQFREQMQRLPQSVVLEIQDIFKS
jgi:hypothetical protein